MDATLITPLTQITDYLLQFRPGPVTVANVVKISQYYGFETFNENNRLTIAGKVILVDVDYDPDAPQQIAKVSISLAIDIAAEQLNFMAQFDRVLMQNLTAEQDLAKFNDNFKKLSVLDKFSSLKFDLFNFLGKEVARLPRAQVSMNLDDRMGYYYEFYSHFRQLDAELGTDAAAATAAGTARDRCYLNINVAETRDTVAINDAKCGVCLEPVGARFQGLIVPEAVLTRLGITEYTLHAADAVALPTRVGGYKVVSLLGSRLVNLKQFWLADLTTLERDIVPVLRDWAFINNAVLQRICGARSAPEDATAPAATTSASTTATAPGPTVAEDDTEELNLDDYVAAAPLRARAACNLLEFWLRDSLRLELQISIPGKFDKSHYQVHDAQLHGGTGDTDTLAAKVNRTEDLPRVLQYIA